MHGAVPDVAYVIQMALTPVFLLAGTAGLLNVFTSRLARVADRVNSLVDIINLEDDPEEARLLQLSYLRRRTLALEVAVLLATLSGVFTCLATLGLFGGAIRQEFREMMLFWFFGGAVASLIGALAAFLFEIISAGHSMLLQIANDKRSLDQRRNAASVRPIITPEKVHGS
ncbi:MULTISPECIES: DUF2721 domain-containing protein [unclassified Sinorhizobium]|uniref:DUF2721 domain-containing protein n=1 Tax=unclassified Sinorhizobium TaxID=2613772 RepID=UPI00352323C2